MEKVLWSDQKIIDEIYKGLGTNLQRYETGGFDEFFESRHSSLRDIGLRIDCKLLEGLDGSSKSEVDDSCIIFEALEGMTASLAQRGGTWLHLSHTYLLDYGRNRWLRGQATEKNIKIHFVSFSPAKIRDDHVSSRPWWNGYIASRIAGSDDIQKIRDVLTVLAKTTETRSQSIERPSIIGDVSLSRLIVRYLKEKPNTTEQENYRAFMKKLNFLSNGVKFLGMDYAEFKDKFAEA